MARTLRSKQHGFDIGTIGHAGDHDVAMLGRSTGRAARYATVYDDGRRALGRAVVTAHRHSRFEQIVGHTNAHQPHAEESDRGEWGCGIGRRLHGRNAETEWEGLRAPPMRRWGSDDGVHCWACTAYTGRWYAKRTRKDGIGAFHEVL